MTAQLREIPLTQVAHELGLDPDPKDKHKWRNQDHILNITDSKFYDFKQTKGGGGAIDLVMQLERCGFVEAVSWLKDRFGDATALQTMTRQIEQVVAEKPRQPFIAPERQETNWQPVKAYLTQSRKLPAAVVDELHREGLVYADQSQNAVFLRRSLEGEVVGASLRGTAGRHNSFKGLAYGTRRSQGWFYVESEQPGPAQQVVLCESAIDALSYRVLHPAQEKTLYLSTDGAGYVPLEQLKQVPKVMLAFDQDQTGEAMAQQLMQDLPQASRHASIGKDWNEDLQTCVQQLQQRLREELLKQQSQQQLAKRDRSYVQSYSQFCQSQAIANQGSWQAELDQHRRAVEAERQEQRQQQERQYNLKLLGQWQEVAITLNRPASYVERIQKITSDYQGGLPLSEQALAARQQDLAIYQRQLQRQQQRGFSL